MHLGTLGHQADQFSTSCGITTPILSFTFGDIIDGWPMCAGFLGRRPTTTSSRSGCARRLSEPADALELA
jgi:hypothetical protein